MTEETQPAEVVVFEPPEETRPEPPQKPRAERDSDLVAEIRTAKRVYADATKAYAEARAAVPAALVAEAKALEALKELKAKLEKSLEAE